jgi:uncharacterized membrane protein YjjP (DUF1212 family)
MAQSQVCKPYIVDGKSVEDVVIIDGKKYYIFSEDRASKMLAALTDYEIIKRSVDLKDQKISVLERIIQSNKEQIAYLTLMLDNAQKRAEVFLKNPPVYKDPTVAFAVGFAVSSLAFGYWSYTSK